MNGAPDLQVRGRWVDLKVRPSIRPSATRPYVAGRTRAGAEAPAFVASSYPGRTVKATRPTVSTSPVRSTDRSTRSPLIAVPFVLPRSSTLN